MLQLVPILGVLSFFSWNNHSSLFLVSVFIWLYFEGKDKNRTIIKIAKQLWILIFQSKAEELYTFWMKEKAEPIDYRRGGVITMFVGIGIYLLGYTYHVLDGEFYLPHNNHLLECQR